MVPFLGKVFSFILLPLLLNYDCFSAFPLPASLPVWLPCTSCLDTGLSVYFLLNQCEWLIFMVYESIFPQHCAPCEAWQELGEQLWSSAAHHALATSPEVGPRSGWATRVPGSAEPRPAWREMQIRPSSMLPAEGGFSVQAPSSLSLQLECWFYFCILWAWEGELISLV